MKMRRSWIGKLISGILFVMTMVMMSGMAMQVSAADYISIEGGNEGAQDYSRWSAPVYSYLSYDGGQTLMKVQAADNFEGVLVEYYDMNYHLTSSKVIPQELPIFGGFYETATNYYLVTGQENPGESSTVEVFRITKYDKSWNKIASAGLTDCNTTIPFDAGSLRFADSGKWLLIRTSHEMYQSDDGKNHQANVTIQVNTDTMSITDSYTEVMNTKYGYISHSFNQFIGIENNKIVALDHGDAYPRSLALTRYPTDITTGQFRSGSCEMYEILKFEGAIGDNTTGASVGGFEIADNYYLTVGNSVVQDAYYASRTTRNIFVIAVAKPNNGNTTATMNQLTYYSEGEASASTPHMVKISSNEYLVMWSRGEDVHYVKVDGTGSQVGSIYSMKGSLSDCKPILADGKIIWYVWEDEIVTFYQIDASNLSATSEMQVFTGHHCGESLGVSNGYAEVRCTVCGGTTSVQVATSVSLYWSATEGGSSSTWHDGNLNVNEVLYYEWRLACDTIARDVKIENLSPDIIELKETSDNGGMITAKQTGTATITFEPKFNPDAKRTVTFTIYEDGSIPITVINTGYANKDIRLKVGGSTELSVYIYPENATNQNLSYESSDTSIATVDSSGVITGKGVGRAVITVKATDGSGVSDTCNVVVSASSGSTGSGSTGGSTDSGSTGGSSSGNTGTAATPPQNGWYEENGAKYWYENGIRQGTEGRGKEIYDPASDAWYWLDAIDGGKMATGKDVYQESSGGKWVRYDENGRMIKGEDYRNGGWYYFEPITGTMMKGPVTLPDGRKVFYDTVTGQMLRGQHTINGQTYVFDEGNGSLISGDDDCIWIEIDGKKYWYENWQRQGWAPENEAYRGKEIYDGVSNAWYWLDNVQQGAMAVSKDVYQESYAGDWGDYEGKDGQRYGKWVRYDENGHMIKGWQTNENGTYYFDLITGTMAKGQVNIDGNSHYFDEVTGILK